MDELSPRRQVIENHDPLGILDACSIAALSFTMLLIGIYTLFSRHAFSVSVFQSMVDCLVSIVSLGYFVIFAVFMLFLNLSTWPHFV
jgi:uncharacterized membrane-anchored protein